MKNSEVIISLSKTFSLDFNFDDVEIKSVLLKFLLEKEFEVGKYFLDLFGCLHVYLKVNSFILNLQLEKDSIVWNYLYLKDVDEEEKEIVEYYNQSAIIKI